jgi:hypothetical protein
MEAAAYAAARARCPNLCIKGLQGSNHVGEKAGGVVVLRSQRDPGDGHTTLEKPLGKQGGFAEAGGGRDEGERTFCSLLELLSQVRAGDQAWPRARNVELGRQQGME